MANQGLRTKETTPTENELRAFSVAQVLDRVPIGRTKLYDEIRNGRLVTTKIGSRTLITAWALHEWLRHACSEGFPPMLTGKEAG